MYLAVYAPGADPGWMMAQLDRVSDRCQAAPPGRWLANLAGMESLLGPAAAIAARFDAHLRAHGVAAEVRLGETRTRALLATTAAAGTPLADLPVGALEALDGGRGETPQRFARWGLRTLGEVAALPRRGVAERLGREGVRFQRWARGEDDGLLLPEPPPPPPLEAGEAFEPAVEGYLPLVPWIERHLRGLCARLEREDQAVATLALRLELDGAAAWVWRQAYALPHRDAKRLLRQLETVLATQPPAAPVAAARLEVAPARPRRAQGDLFGDEVREAEGRERLLGRLRALLDDAQGQRVGAAAMRDLHRSDLFAMVPFQPPPAPRVPPPRRAVRALRACRPPEPIALALPRLPAAAGELRIEGARCRLGRIVRASGPWRASGEWWSDGAWSRDEWDVEFERAGFHRLLYDRRRRQWFHLGRYD